jgi:ParB family chromosome partitioning protein
MTKNYKRIALGRGFRALIPEEKPSQDYFMCPLDQILAPDIPLRKQPSQTTLLELAKSIKEQGILQPLLVRKINSKYMIIAGQRRFQAAKLAKLTEVPVIVKQTTTKVAFELALIENLQREDLNPIEEAEALKYLMEKYGYTQELLSQRLAKERTTLANKIRLLKLPPTIKSMIASGKLTEGHGRALLSLKNPLKMQIIASKAIKKRLSVRQIEKLIKDIIKEKKSPKNNVIDIELSTLSQRLQQILGTKVTIKDKKGTGTIIISYSSYEELNRLLNIITLNQ